MASCPFSMSSNLTHQFTFEFKVEFFIGLAGLGIFKETSCSEVIVIHTRTDAWYLTIVLPEIFGFPHGNDYFWM